MNTRPYQVASLPAWREAARVAIIAGIGENGFVGTCHPLNQVNALNAYRIEQARTALQSAKNGGAK